MKKLNLRLIEKNEALQSRLKEAAREGVREYLSGKDPPEDALDYVIAALCLGETSQQFHARLQQLFEKDCGVIVASLTKFFDDNPEFVLPTPSPSDSKNEGKKETAKSKRQKIVWDTSLDKSTATESSGDERKKKTESRKQPSKKNATMAPVPEPGIEESKKRSVRSSVLHKRPPSIKQSDPNGPQIAKPREQAIDEGIADRWQTESTEDASRREHGTETNTPESRRMPRSRLFQSALGGIKQQFLKKDKSTPETRSSGHTEAVAGRRSERIVHKDCTPAPPSQREENILDRIRKPDGSAFEEWELKRDVLPGKKRQGEPLQKDTVLPDPPIGEIQTPDMSEVESLKLKIARLEKEVLTAQEQPTPQTAYRDFDRRSICVKNVHFLANEEVLAAHFHSCQPIISIRIAKDTYDRPKGFCFVEFAEERSVTRALELDQSLLLGRQIAVVRKLTKPPAPSQNKHFGGQEWTRSQWKTGLQGKPNPQPNPALHEEPHDDDVKVVEEEEEEDIMDFAIDTGSQDLP